MDMTEQINDLKSNDALSGFEEYHRRIYEMEMKLKVYSAKCMEAEVYRDMRETLDRSRTNQHNIVIMDVGMLNRLAKNENILPVYEGVVSEERPYRRELADAVLEYIRDIIKNRL
ncbi:MAG: DUF3232 domain-containing protein [Ruminococcaceae bacterium]|nr:DUF3232 domain-containing protein [Oscillospiraceae bacterium]